MTPNDDETAKSLRLQLVEQLVTNGTIRSGAWRTPVEAVPRHEFLPDFFVAHIVDDGSPTTYQPVSARISGVGTWLAAVYQDVSLVTQLDGELNPSDVHEPVVGTPTSSSTLPSLVVSMWEDLDVRDGDRVLEVGTGSGYSTALGCRRLGDDNVTSIEVDDVVAARARNALERAGCRPHLVVGDGLAGVPDGAPYDRVIATCSVRHVPPAWIAQCRPGSTVLVTLSGWLGATGLARLTVTGPGTAEGRFISPDVSFMPARSHTPAAIIIPEIGENVLSERPARIAPTALQGWGAELFVAQLAAPDAQYFPSVGGDITAEHLVVQPDDSYVTFTEQAGNWLVRQGGPVAVWDAVESGLIGWRQAGSPPLESFRIVVTPRRQSVTVTPGLAYDFPGIV